MATVTIHMPDGRTYQMDIEKWAQLDTWGYPPGNISKVVVDAHKPQRQKGTGPYKNYPGFCEWCGQHPCKC